MWLFRGAVALALLYAFEAVANPVVVTYRNPGTQHPYTELRIQPEGLPVQSRTVVCPPGATCNTTIGLAPGSYTVRATAKSTAPNTAESPESNARTYTVLAPVPCVFDADLDGHLTNVDFAVFLADFTNGYWTAQDFQVFLTRFGGACA